MARKQTLVQLTDELLEALDREAARRQVSRSALIREAVESHLHDEIEAEINRGIVEGYSRMPQTDEELAWSAWLTDQTLRRLDEDEDESW